MLPGELLSLFRPFFTGRRRLLVMVAVVLAGAAALAVPLLTGRAAAPQPMISVGEQERVRLTGPDGQSVEALAVIDTGASRSSIDEDLADELDLDLDDAETVTVRSALGRDERPLVDLDVQLAGRSLDTTASVADRSELAAPVLIGRRDLDGYQVVVGEERLTGPDEQSRRSSMPLALATSWSPSATAVLSMLPIALAVVLFLRSVVGVRPHGNVGPVLLALAYVQSGLAVGIAVTVLVVTGTAWTSRRPTSTGNALLVAGAAALLLALLVAIDDEPPVLGWGVALPLLVAAALCEGVTEPGFVRFRRYSALLTVTVAALVAAVLGSPLVGALAASTPLLLAAVGLLWALAAAAYSGPALLHDPRSGSSGPPRR